MMRLSILVSFMLQLGAIANGATAITVVEGGRPLARLVIPGKASAPASLIADGIRKSTGAQLSITPEGAAADAAAVEIHVRSTRYVREQKIATEGLHEHGFVIAFPDERHVVLLSPSPLGLEFAATEFLERYVGVRWLFPGALGEHVPQRDSLTISTNEVREQPAYLSRTMSGFGRDGTKAQALEQRDWGRRLRMGGSMEFHHNLFKLIPPKVYGAAEA